MTKLLFYIAILFILLTISFIYYWYRANRWRNAKENEIKKRTVSMSTIEGDLKNLNEKYSRKFFGFSPSEIITILLNFAVALGAVAALSHSSSLDEKIHRPYLSFQNSALELTEVAVKSERYNQYLLETYIKNHGDLPAKFKMSKVVHTGYPNVFWEKEELNEGVIFSNESVRVAWIGMWNSEAGEFYQWATSEKDPYHRCDICKVRVNVSYGFIDDYTYNRYGSTLENEKTRVKDGRLFSSETSWVVDELR